MLQLLGASPVVGKSIAKFKIEDLTATAGRQYITGGDVAPSAYAASPDAKFRLALKLPLVRDQLMKLIAEECHFVASIDPDIAILKSVSMSAKIVYQRKRNIARRLEAIENGQVWHRLESFISNLRSG